MKAEGSAVTGGTHTSGHIALPRPPERRPHVEPTRKPTGLDWSTLKPACRSCGTRTSALNRDDQCKACAPPTSPAPGPAADPGRSARTKGRQAGSGPTRQYRRPIGPTRPRGTASRARVDEHELCTDYAAGATVPALATSHGIMPATVRAILDRNGIERRDDRRQHSGGANRLPASISADVARLYAEGLSKAKVAKQLGIGMTTVSRIMAAAGIVGRKGQGGRADGAAPLKARIVALGTTPREINRWALDVGMVEIPKPGIPSRSVVDAWEQAHA